MQSCTNDTRQSRRSFLQNSLLGGAGLGLGIATVTEVRAAPLPNADESEIRGEFDVVVFDGGTLPDFSRVPQRRWHNQIYLNPYLYAILAEEKCAEAGVKIACHEFLFSGEAHPDGGWAIGCVGFGTMRRIRCKQIIDCTGGAEVVGKLGFERMREAEIQPGSMYYSLNKPMNAGRINVDRLHVHGADSLNSRTVTHANITGRKAVLDLVRNSKARLMHLQQETGFRESYRIVGETIITVKS